MNTVSQNQTHTPGPWTEHEGFITARFSDGIIHDICDPRCAPPELFAEMDANARLIASAPELLATLEDTAEALMDYLRSVPHGADADCESAYQHACATIANARGIPVWPIAEGNG